MGKAEILTAIGGVIATILGVLFGRKAERAKAKKVDAEADSITVSTTEKAVAIWEKLNKQLHAELESLHKEVNILRGRISDMEIKIDELEKENEGLHKEVSELRRENSELRKS